MKLFIALGANEYKLKKGITPIDLKWKYNGIQDWCDKVRFTSKDVVIGHSIGAAVALIVAEKNPPKELHLYSPSPIFTETIKLLPKSHLSYYGKKRQREVSSIPKVACPVTVYVGELEIPAMKKTAKIIAKKLHAKLVVVPGKNHRNIIQEVS
jgi:pimeloyl-ACP methyl ester carboxylesterase